MVFDKIYSAAPSTELSLPLLLSMSEKYDNNTKDVRLGFSTVNELLSIQGYKTYYINGKGTLIGKRGFNGDFSIPDKRENLEKSRFREMLFVLNGILRGKFDDHLKNWDNSSAKESRLKKLELLKRSDEFPRFIFNHINSPLHAFENDYNTNYIQEYSERLEKANLFMKEDVEAALSNDNAIIILYSDHGANLYFDVGYRLYGNVDEKLVERRHLIDMYGAFLAVKIPQNMNISYYDSIKIVQDVFFSVFASLYQDEEIKKYKMKETVSLKFSSIKKVPIKDGIIQIGADKGKSLYVEKP